MAQRPYDSTSIAALEQARGWSPIRRALDVRSFGVNAWTAHEDGGVVIPEHSEEESGHEELYVVTAGHATFTVDGEAIDGPPGTVVLVRDPELSRGAVARRAETTILSMGGRPGEAFRPMAWETNQDVLGLFEEARYEDARDLLQQSLERYEERSVLLYNLACAEARLGDVEPAFDHLAQALRGRPALAAGVRDDEDLAALRDDPRLAALLAVAE